MPVWVMTVMRQGTGYRISLPKKWVVENLMPDERMMFMIESGKGHLEVYTERSYYEQKLGKNPIEPDLGTKEPLSRATGQGLTAGACREHEEARAAAADTCKAIQ